VEIVGVIMALHLLITLKRQLQEVTPISSDSQAMIHALNMTITNFHTQVNIC
jgi:hypothetical protein